MKAFFKSFPAADYAASKDFYEKSLGLKIVRSTTASHTDLPTTISAASC